MDELVNNQPNPGTVPQTPVSQPVNTPPTDSYGNPPVSPQGNIANPTYQQPVNPPVNNQPPVSPTNPIPATPPTQPFPNPAQPIQTPAQPISNTPPMTAQTPPSTPTKPKEIKTQAKTKKVRQVVTYFLIVLEILLGLRFFFKLLNATNASKLVLWIFELSDVFLIPFEGIVKNTGSAKHILEWSTLFGMGLYVVLAFIIMGLIKLFAPTNPDKVWED